MRQQHKVPERQRKKDKKTKKEKEVATSMKELMPMMRVRREDISDDILLETPFDAQAIDDMERSMTRHLHLSNARFLARVVELLPTQEESVRATLAKREELYRNYADGRSSMTFTVMGFMFQELGRVVDLVETLAQDERVTPHLLRSKYVTERMSADAAQTVADGLAEDQVLEQMMSWNVMLQFLLAAMTRDTHRKELVFLMPVMQALRQYHDIVGDETVSDAEKETRMQDVMGDVFQKQFSKFGVDQQECDELMQKVAQRIPQLNDQRNTVMFTKLVKLLTSGADQQQVQQQLPTILGADVSGEFAQIMHEFQQKRSNNNKKERKK